MLINASEKFQPLKKSKGSKRKEVDRENRLAIAQVLQEFKDTGYAKVFDKEYFYFNKQAIQLTNVDENGESFEDHLEEGKKSLKLKPIRLEKGENVVLDAFEIETFNEKQFSSLKDYFDKALKPKLAALDYKEDQLAVFTEHLVYFFDKERESLLVQEEEVEQSLGCGKIVIKPTYKKGTKTRADKIQVSVELMPQYQKDYEIIPYHRDEAENTAAIAAFMKQYITKPFEYLENVVGVEINFNKVFYKPEKLRPVSEILEEIAGIDVELTQLEKELGV